MVCRFYRAACRRYRKSGLTFSASAHLSAQEGRPFWRNRIDGVFLLLVGQANHCQQQFQRESRINQEQ